MSRCFNHDLMTRHRGSVDDHELFIREVLAEDDDSSEKKSSVGKYVKVVLSVIIVLLVVAWIIPFDAFPPRVHREKIPSLEEVLPSGIVLPDRPSGQASIESFVRGDSPVVKMVTARVVSAACSQTDKRCYAEAVFYFVRDKIGYVTDPLDEYYEFPEETLLTGSADCDGKAILLASMLRSIGVETRFVFVPRHVYVEAWLPKKWSPTHEFSWVPLDPTCSSCAPGEVPSTALLRGA